MQSEIRYVGRTKTTVYNKFRGVSGNDATVDGAIEDCRNLSDLSFPAVKVREKRNILNAISDSYAFGICGGKMLWVKKQNDGTFHNPVYVFHVYMDGVDTRTVNFNEDRMHWFASVGNTIILFPEGEIISGGRIAQINIKTVDGTDDIRMVKDSSISTTALVDSVGNGSIAGVSANNNRLTISYTDVANAGYDYGHLFCKGDGVKVFGSMDKGTTSLMGTNTFSVDLEPVEAIIRDVTYDHQAQKVYLDFEDGTFSEFVKQYSTGDVGTKITISNLKIYVTRGMPQLEYVFESSGRLWGYKGQEIYASSLGDPYNWNKYQKISTDSFYWNCIGSGDITGAEDYMGYPTFFRENSIIKVAGARDGIPDNFSTVEYHFPGVKSGCGKTVKCCGKYMFYMGIHGIYAYSGGVPSLISSNISERFVSDGCAVTDGSRYYISAKDGSGKVHLYVYNVLTGLWYIEDEVSVVSGGYLDGFWVQLGDGRIATFGAYRGQKEVTEESDIPWMLQTTDFLQSSNGAKYVNRLILRYQAQKGTWFDVEGSYNGDDFTRIFHVECKEAKKSISIPLKSMRRDSFRIRISGVGAITLYSIVLEGQSGSGIVH